MKEKTCCFSGHRKIPSEKYLFVKDKTKSEIEKHIKQGYMLFETGGALGFDTLAACAVIELRETYNFIKLILVLPCLSQTRGWNSEDVQVYERIKTNADRIIYTSETYYRGCMHKRNR